jgi:hypothetical protein
MSENATSEANFDQSASIAQQQDSIEVTAHSGVDTGLDKRVAQPREDEGLAPNSPLEPRTGPRLIARGGGRPWMETDEFTQCIHEPPKGATESIVAT